MHHVIHARRGGHAVSPPGAEDTIPKVQGRSAVKTAMFYIILPKSPLFQLFTFPLVRLSHRDSRILLEECPETLMRHGARARNVELGIKTITWIYLWLKLSFREPTRRVVNSLSCKMVKELVNCLRYFDDLSKCKIFILGI